MLPNDLLRNAPASSVVLNFPELLRTSPSRVREFQRYWDEKKYTLTFVSTFTQPPFLHVTGGHTKPLRKEQEAVQYMQLYSLQEGFCAS